jgi:hypothetical protein
MVKWSLVAFVLLKANVCRCLVVQPGQRPVGPDTLHRNILVYKGQWSQLLRGMVMEKPRNPPRALLCVDLKGLYSTMGRVHSEDIGPVLMGL